MSKLKNTGTFVPIDFESLKMGVNSLEALERFQEKTGEMDTDKVINQLRDSVTGALLGFNLTNEDKNGFDGMSSYGRNLEVKSLNMSARSWGATFNDTTLDKAECFKETNTVLVAGVWRTAADLRFMVVGNNPKVGDFLYKKVQDYLNNRNAIRCTQTISIKQLIEKYGFDIVAVNATPEEVYGMLTTKYKKIKVDMNMIYTLEELDNVNILKSFKEAR